MVMFTFTDLLNTFKTIFHITGAGGFVINDKNELLVICERFRTKRHWKLPGGQVDVGRYLAVRIVYCAYYCTISYLELQ